jgi:hypothetical protein
MPLARKVTERRGNQDRIAVIQRGFQVRRHVFLGLQVFGWIPRRGDSLGHG